MTDQTGLLLIIGNLNKKIPDWLKYLFKLVLLIIVVTKLLGFNLIDIYLNSYHFKMYIYITSSLFMLSSFFSLFLLHKFANKTIHIPEVLPNFIINWLKILQTVSSNKESIHYFKNKYYLEIVLCILVIIIVTLIV